ncbi:MAG: ATP-binding cassette domain-containing protein [Bacteriodetes bacterium]|nr:ATP-binding cassette domain-containing protein [Bacteroidota bacterium]
MKWNRLLFSHVAPLVRLGSTRPLTAEDMPELEPMLHPKEVEERFRNIPTNKPYRFIWDSFTATGFTARNAILADVIRLPFALGGPIMMKVLLESLALMSVHQATVLHCVLLACGLSCMVIADGIIIQHFYYNALMTHARIVNGLSMRVFRHSLRLTRSAQMTTQTGDMVNHVASDTEGIGEASFFIPEFVQSTLLLIGALILLYMFLGVAALAAIGTMILMSPITSLAARRFQKYDTELWKHRDNRVTLMSQILSGIRIIKYFAWERSIVKEVDAVRGNEIGAFVKLIKGEALGVMLFLSTSTLVAFVGFGTYTLLGGVLSAGIVFPCLLLFMQLEGPIGMMPHFIKNLAHARVAAERLHTFFQLGLHKEDDRVESEKNKPVALDIDKVTIEYTSTDNGNGTTVTKAVHEFSLRTQAGTSVAIVGEVGAGKSSLLLAVLGEVSLQSGEVRFPNLDAHERPRIAYVPQEAYILNATIKENILFGEDDVSEPEIEEALQNSALQHDIQLMSAGLDTEIGERGVNLSGGQKMRIALARAVLRKPGLVLLDDPIAAVDVATESHLIDNLLFGQWKDVTRVVTTHRLAHLTKFDTVVFMNNGCIEATGTLQELLLHSNSFREFYAEQTHAEEVAHTLHVTQTVNESQKTISDGKLIDDEDRAIGSIKADVFLKYLYALGGINRRQAPWVYASLVLTCLLIVILPITQSIWLGYFSDALKSGTYLFEWMKNPLLDIMVYGGIGLCLLAAGYVERVVWMMRATTAGRDIHNQTLRAVLAAPLRFFDTTPMGRILNRFSRDIQLVDDELSWNFESALRSLSLMLGTLVLICVTAPVVILFAAPALFVFYKIQKMYRVSAREAKRINSMARSPRYAHYKETITGLPVVRAYRKEEMFTEKFVDLLGYFQRTFLGSILLNRWFSTRAPIVSGVIALATTISIVFLIDSGSMTAGIAGVVITYSITFWGNLNWCVRSFSEVEMCMTAFERVRSYGAIIPEEPLSQRTEPINTTWIENGTISFDNVWAKYAPQLPYVLKDVNFTIEGGMRVGIIGRTGSGKTTLFQTLFRFIEIEKGEIYIDDNNIASMPLEQLRRAMAVIPQDPTLFIGTIRSNLDRFSKYSDEDIWSALERVKMDDAIRTLGGLQAPVVENGQNFSQGQRQLLCLARAILTQAKIIVMDEATASVDVQTDALIQETIRTEFAGVTVLIIAHRLNSVADADMIIEMGDGEVKSITRNRPTINDSGELITERVVIE